MQSIILLFLSFSVLAATKTYTSENQKFVYEKVVELPDVVWGFDFLPDGRILFTLREGKMGLYDKATKKVTYLENLPKVYVAGQAGLLDVRVHPDFAKNSMIYFTYSEAVKDKSTTAIGRAKLNGARLDDVEKIFSAHEPNSEDIHYGSRIVFHENHLFVSIGERNKRENAQDLAYHQGKILRLKEDGTSPTDNPFIKTKWAKPEIWSYGHRNPQGLAKNETTGVLYEAEFGPRGGDEVNLIKPGLNYGWPIVTYGKEYWGPSIGTTAKSGIEQPLVYWVPSISPSALAIYSGDKFPKWKDNLFLATLSGAHIRRVVLSGDKVVGQEELIKDLDYRIRNVRTGPEGFLYFSTDEGQIALLKPL